MAALCELPMRFSLASVRELLTGASSTHLVELTEVERSTRICDVFDCSIEK